MLGKPASITARLSCRGGELRVGGAKGLSTKPEPNPEEAEGEALGAASEEAAAVTVGAVPLLLVMEIRRPSKSRESCVIESWSEAGVPIQSKPCCTLS